MIFPLPLTYWVSAGECPYCDGELKTCGEVTVCTECEYWTTVYFTHEP